MRDSTRPDAFRELQELAALHGIQPDYRNMAGKTQHASAETLKALLGALGQPMKTGRDIRDALRGKKEGIAARIVEPVLVAWNGKPLKVPLYLPKSLDSARIAYRVLLENGEQMAGRVSPCALSSQNKSDSARSPACSLSLPILPYGYHRLRIDTAAKRFESLVISAPEKAFAPSATRRNLGIFLPLYSLHSQKSWGAGNFNDWHSLTRWGASAGVNIVAALPLLAAFLDKPFCEPSPYSPASRLFWNEFYLDIESIPEFAVCTEAQRLVASGPFQQRLQRFRESELIDYRAEMAPRRSVLEVLARFFFGKRLPRRNRFDRFLREHPETKCYAEFRATAEKQGAGWQAWPKRMREGKLRPGDYADAAKRYHLYAQFLAQEQMDHLLRAGKRTGAHLYLDLPLGVNGAGYDTWREQKAFALNASAGAPPDVFFTRGQDWGFAPLHPQNLREQGYRYVLDYLRFQMRHTDMLRIDHVMSLHRLYWIPKGLSAAEGAYVTYPADELYAIFCLESHRHRTMLVGENLGTVSPEVNTAMDRHGFRKMYVLQYELPPDAKRPPRLPPKRCVASVNTHDMPPFAAFWGGDDIADRARLGLIRGNKRRQQDRERVKMKQSLVKFLARRRLLKNQVQGAANVFKASLKWLVSSRAETVLINLEDLWVEQLQQNVPGTSTERPNWRRKARYTLEQIKRMPDLAGMLRDLQRSRSGGKERSPSPRPSPTGRGRRLRHGLENPKPLDIIQSRHEFSLFQRERAGARERASHPQRIQMGKG